MTRAINLSMKEADVIARCLTERVGVSAIERLPNGGREAGLHECPWSRVDQAQTQVAHNRGRRDEGAAQTHTTLVVSEG